MIGMGLGMVSNAWVDPEPDRSSPTPTDTGTDRPHPARVYDFLLGGKDNFRRRSGSRRAGAASQPAQQDPALEKRAFVVRAGVAGDCHPVIPRRDGHLERRYVRGAAREFTSAGDAHSQPAAVNASSRRKTWRESGLGAPDDIEALKHRIVHLEQHVLDLRVQLDEHGDELAAARAANREIMLRANLGS
jgi:hypothetical protein